MCWCDPSKRTPWCPNCDRVRPDLVVHAPAAMMSSPVGDPVPMGPVPEKPLNPRWADRLYFWLGAEAERVVRRGEALKLRELFNRPRSTR